MFPYIYLLYALISYTVISVTANSPNIFIIGAGPAGIAAAAKLLENRFLNITILEAEPRIGGRIRTVKFGRSNIDLGARWCHGEVDNVVYETVKTLDLLGSTETTDKYFYSSGKVIDEEFVNQIWGIWKDIEDDREKLGSNNRSLGDYFIEQYQERTKIKYGNDTSKLKAAHDLLEYVHLSSMESEGAFTWFDVASKEGYVVCAGDQTLHWKGQGYNTFLDVLMKKYPDPHQQLPIDDKVKLNKEVTRISYSPESSQNKVDIECSDGSSYKADHVIFTPSVGVLKEKGLSLFSPALPATKLSAIKNIGIAAVMKVVLDFQENWSGETFQISFIWNENDTRSVSQEFSEGPSLNGRSWLTYLVEIYKTDHNPGVYVAWFTGSLVPQIELLPKETLINGIYHVINKFLGNHYSFQKPVNILSSNWYENPHFKGTYSFNTIHTCKFDGGKCAREILAEPIRSSQGRPILQFAGEATNTRHHSTVHGAVETGYREAQRLIDLYK